MDDLPQPISAPKKTVPHYHGDYVRALIFTAGLLMLIGLPYFQNEINLPIYFSIIAVIILVFLAGLTNPKQVWIAYVDFVVSLLGFSIFEYEAVVGFGSNQPLFLINQTIALVFFFALYFSTKTLRGFFLRNR
jgi:hypothetical protein